MNNTPTLRELAEGRGLLIGAGIDADSFHEEKYKNFLVKNFNCLYPSWALKWDCLHNEKGKFDFELADRMVDFALNHDCKVRLNCLLWHRDIPSWVQELKPSQEEAWDIVSNHIHTVLTHFKGRIQYCDVVNEAIGDSGFPRPNGYLELLGEGWIERAFREAHKAAPEVELFYCDYRIKADAKWNWIIKMIQDFCDRAVPIHGVAVQLHSRLVPALSERQISHHLKKLAPRPLKLHLPECGVWIPPYIGPEALQATIYGGMVKAGLKARAEQIGFWWPTDWRAKVKPWVDFQGNPARPGLFGKSLEEKPAAKSVRLALSQTQTHQV